LNMNAVAIVSGGLDSAVAARWAQAAGFKVVAATTFLYGQSLAKEVQSARAVVERLDIPKHFVLELPWEPFAGSALTGGKVAIPHDRTIDEMMAGKAPTYVPNRNMTFIAIAAAVAYRFHADAVVGGWHWDDSSGYPDCREEFLAATEVATRHALDNPNFTILRPLITLGKTDIVRMGLRNGAPIELTWSCYEGGEKPCGKCDSCILRAHAFMELGIPDPALEVYNDAS